MERARHARCVPRSSLGGQPPAGQSDAWSKIPKKPGAAGKKQANRGARVEAGLLGFTSATPLSLLAEDGE
jgi:hypothetical protein